MESEVQNTYNPKPLIVSIIVLLVLSMLVIFLLPPSESPLSQEDKERILNELSGYSVIPPTISERRVILESIAQSATASEKVFASEDEKRDVLKSLQR